MNTRWAIVEVMGHRRYAGVVEEVTVAGTPMLRVTVPAWTRNWVESDYRSDGRWERDVREEHASYVVELGGSSIFALTSCSEETVRATVPNCHRGLEGHERVEGVWRTTTLALTVSDGDDGDDDGDDGVPW